MSKKTKSYSKVISLLLAVMMILSSLPFTGISALAEENGDFYYEILDDGTAEITGYYGEAKTLEIPSTLDGYSVISIGYEAFWYCHSLTSITIPNSVTSIGNSAFSECSNLTSITIPGSVTSIGGCAFEDCDSLTSITIPDSVTSIGPSAFYGTGYYNDDANWENGVLYIGNHLIEANNDEIPSEYSINEGTITIADYAFSDCYSLTSVTIPNSVTSIGDYAFAWCDSLKNITIPNSVTRIGEDAFYSCESLTSITVDENNKNYSSEGGVLFNKSKTQIILYPKGKEDKAYTLPDGITDIGEAFSGSTNLEEVVIPNGVTELVYSFSGCTSLKSVSLPNTLKSIGRRAFGNCTALSNVEIPDSVTNIGDSAFNECYSLTSVTIPNSVTNIGDSAFDNCDSLKSVTIPNSVTSMGDEVFWGCKSLTSITVDENNKNYSSQDGVLFNKEKTELIQYPIGNERTSYSIPAGVTSICHWAFYNCTSLTSVIIPNSVTSIGDSAFEDCYSLTSVDLGNSVTSIGSSAFEYCEKLTNIAIPDSVTSIGDSAFEYCESLTSIIIPDSVTRIASDAFAGTGYYNDDANWENGVLYIGNHLIASNSDEIPSEYSINEGTVTIADDAFYNCYSLTSITIPNSVTSIGGYAFGYCDSLTSITIPDSVTSIGSSAFYGTGYYNDDANWENGVLYIGKHLVNTDSEEHGEVPAEYSINEGTITIADGAFSYCYSLTSVTIPGSVTSIGNGAFLYCDSLTSVTIPDSVTSIGNEAFNGCNSLTSIIVDENNNAYSSQDGVLLNKDKTLLIQYPAGNGRTSYSIPGSVTSIGDYAFAYCDSLTSITIPNGVTSIGDRVFDICNSLTSITIPSSVTSIGDEAFDYSALETIYGYENSYAQTYAENHGYEFVAIPDFVDEESGITVDADKSELPEDTELVVSVKEETDSSVTYDISLQSGGVEVQPTGGVTVKIPVPETMNGESVKVYRREADGTMTDMNAVYKDGFMVFTTEHFSEYMLKAEESAVKAEPGDVNGDGKINALDVLIVKRYIAKYDDAKLEGDMFARADVSGDGKVNAKDALAIMQKIAKLITSFDEIK